VACKQVRRNEYEKLFSAEKNEDMIHGWDSTTFSQKKAQQ
jgi:hypothetical protein